MGLFVWSATLTVLDVAVFATHLRSVVDHLRDVPSPRAPIALRVPVTTLGLLLFAATTLLASWIWWFIIPPAVVSAEWNHHCEGFPITAVINVLNREQAPLYIPVSVSFFETANNSPLFSYSSDTSRDSRLSNSSDEVTTANFVLRSIDTPDGNLPPNRYPTIKALQYDRVGNITGTCTTLDEDTASPNATCIHGSIDGSTSLEINFVSLTRLISPTFFLNTTLSSGSDPWGASPPILNLRQVNILDGTLGEIVLQTAVTPHKDCTRLKVCVNGVSSRDNGAVGPEVMIPMSILARQMALSATFGCNTSDP